MGYPSSDNEYRDEVVATAELGGFTAEDGWYLGFPEDFEPQPKPGDAVRLYGRGIGSTVRGLFLNGEEVWYRTEAEEEQRHRDWCAEKERADRERFELARAEMDARYEALPSCFRRRIDKFRRNNPDFRWKYESYEVFTCEQAVLLAPGIEGQRGASRPPHTRAKRHRAPLRSRWDAFRALSFDDQRKAAPGLSDGHSGNTFGIAMLLAWFYLTNDEAVIRLHGALAPLVGSKEYGCVPRED